MQTSCLIDECQPLAADVPCLLCKPQGTLDSLTSLELDSSLLMLQPGGGEEGFQGGIWAPWRVLSAPWVARAQAVQAEGEGGRAFQLVLMPRGPRSCSEQSEFSNKSRLQKRPSFSALGYLRRFRRADVDPMWSFRW